MADVAPVLPQPVYSFASRKHPGAVTWPWVYAGALVRPLSVCVLPVMIGALIAVLQGYPALAFLTVGLPMAFAVASLWTLFRMQAVVAEVLVRPGEAAVRTIWECARGRSPQWAPLYELRDDPDTLTLALGDTTYELDRAAWPEADTLLQTLKNARL